MGRLTLNVLLSFAQFEREVLRAYPGQNSGSKRKGLWVGRMVPLGYKVENRKAVVIKNEAEHVRTIFRRYLELGAVDTLLEDLHERKVVTKVRPLSTGRTVGGIPFALFGAS
jgi:DNA invertase Pin-like site-specific DNA recombinase